jgi:MFS family permease
VFPNAGSCSTLPALRLSAWLSRVFGRKNYYMTCVALFSVSSLMCGLAPSLVLPHLKT